MRRLARLAPFASALVAALAVLWSPPARADMFGGDLAFLSGLLAQAVQTADNVGRTLTVARQQYDEVRRFAGIAQDAQAAFQAFAEDPAIFGQEFQSAFEEAFPSVGDIRREGETLSSERWGAQHGEFRRLIRMCLRDGGRCLQLNEALSLRELHTSLETLFRTPSDAASGKVLTEAATALKGASTQEAVAEQARARAELLARECQADSRAGRSTALATCQAAGAAATIAALETQGAALDAAAQANRLAALQVLMEKERRDLEAEDALFRQRLIEEGAKAMVRPPPRLEAEGFDLLEGF